MDDATIEANSKGIEAILLALLTQRDAPVPGMLLNNLEWFAGMGFLEFLRDVGKFARMGTMLNKDRCGFRPDIQCSVKIFSVQSRHSVFGKQVQYAVKTFSILNVLLP